MAPRGRKRAPSAPSYASALDVRLPLSVLLERALTVADSHLDTAEMVLASFHPFTNEIEFVAGWAQNSATLTELTRLQKALFQKTVKHPVPYWSSAPGKDESLADFSSISKGKLSAIGCLPILAEGGMAGFLYVALTGKKQFDDRTKEYLACIADFLGGAVGAHRTVHELEESLTKTHAEEGHKFGAVVLQGVNKSFVETAVKAQKAARAVTPVFLVGETGTGRSALARAIHEGSDRKTKPFITFDCTNTPEDGFESELFGFARGAFNAALEGKRGRLEAANNGTLFLDEIADMPASAQEKLVNFLETKTFRRVGDDKDMTVDVRIIACTAKNLKLAFSQGLLRKDLYYRLAGVVLELPPLRERKEDIPALTRHFLLKSENNPGSKAMEFTDEALALLQGYSWPGNLREVKQVVDNVLLFLDPGVRIVGLADLPPEINPDQREDSSVFRHLAPIKRSERTLIIQALRKHRGNKKMAAHHLQIARATLYRKLDEYRIEKAEYSGPAI